MYTLGKRCGPAFYSTTGLNKPNTFPSRASAFTLCKPRKNSSTFSAPMENPWLPNLNLGRSGSKGGLSVGGETWYLGAVGAVSSVLFGDNFQSNPIRDVLWQRPSGIPELIQPSTIWCKWILFPGAVIDLELPLWCSCLGTWNSRSSFISRWPLSPYCCTALSTNDLLFHFKLPGMLHKNCRCKSNLQRAIV